MTSLARKWSPASPGVEETFITSTPNGTTFFQDQLQEVLTDYLQSRQRNGLSDESALTVTLFLSDAANQEHIVHNHPLYRQLVTEGTAVTLLQQPPVAGKVALLAYHAPRDGSARRQALTPNGCKQGGAMIAVETPAYRYVYGRNLKALADHDAASQTKALMGTAGIGLLSHGVSLAEVVRTWLYIHDIDTNYRPVSDARNRLFEHHGISARTGFPASTGIEGRSGDHRDVLMMDAFAVQGLKPGQSLSMTAPGFMNPTVEYGVTFERGRALLFGDRRHLYVSGTASIDHFGRILHEGDAGRQTQRAIENVAALLGNSGAQLADMQYLLVYLRDPQDAASVEAALQASALAEVPRIMVRAPVCRPGWLVEIEGVALDGKGDAAFAAF